MLNSQTPRLEIVTEQSSAPEPPPKRPTLQTLHNAAFELYDVAIRARELAALIQGSPEISYELRLNTTLRVKMQVLNLLLAQAIAKAEGAQ